MSIVKKLIGSLFAPAVTDALKTGKNALAAPEGKSLTRRIIAVGITSVWLLNLMVADALGALSFYLAEESAGRALQAASVFDGRAAALEPMVMGVLAFYFLGSKAGALLGGILRKK